MEYTLTAEEQHQLNMMQRDWVILNQQAMICELQLPRFKEAATGQMQQLQAAAIEIRKKYEWPENVVFDLQSLKFVEKT